jgi:arylsulfatase A-like enzyme
MYWAGAAALCIAAAVVLVIHTPRVPIDVERLERGTEALLARGRAIHRRAETFEQHAALSALAPNRRNGSYYRFDDHLDAAVVERSAVPSAPRGSAGTLAIEYDGGDAVRFVPREATHVIEDGTLRFTYGAGDYLIATGLSVERDAVGDIELRIRVERGRKLELAWSREPLDRWRRGPRWRHTYGSIHIDLVPDGEFHDYVIDAGNALRYRTNAGETIQALFAQPSDVPGDRIEIDYIRFVPKAQTYAAAPAGVTHETLGNEMRAAIYVNTPLRLQYTLTVPAERPVLSVGMGVLEDGDPVRFQVAVTAGGRTTQVHAETVAGPQRWHDASVDLSRWAAESVEITFEAASRHNVAFWSNPILFSPPVERFNVLLVLEDTLRADHLSVYGYARPTSPTKERLAAGGVVFEHAFSQATATRPSCPSLMTSLYPTATGVWSFHQMLDDRYVTLAEILRSQGFVTGALIQNPNAGPAAGLHQGYSYLEEGSLLGGRPETIYRDRALQWLEAHGERNFFLYVHLVDPHGEYDPPPPFDRWFRETGGAGTPAPPDRKGNLDPEWVEAPTVEGRRLLYDGEILHNDHHFEALLEKVRELGLWDDTLIVFLSDHGEHLGEREYWRHKPPGFVQVLRVPMLMVYAKGLPTNRRVTAPVQLLDVMPTILELAGIDASTLLLAGDSLVPLARGEEPERWRDRVGFSEEVVSYDVEREKAIGASVFFDGWHVLRSKYLPSLQAFDYARDSQETEAREFGRGDARLEDHVLAVTGALREVHLAVWRALTTGGPRAVHYAPEVQERLRELGYIE